MSDPETRLRWVTEYERTGQAAAVCAAFGISRPTLRKWVERFRTLGPAGLQERPRTPARSPNRKIHAAEEALILRLRRDRRLGLHRLRRELREAHGLTVSADTILKVLRRGGEGRLPDPAPPPADPPPLPAAARPDGLAGTITDLITSGALRPGDKLSEAALGARFGVGRTLVREALKQLAVGGLVVLQRNRGAFVAQPTRQEIEQAYAARRLIEGALVDDVACHCTAHDVRRLRRHVDAQSAALAAGRRGDVVRLLTEFHLVIAGLAENQVLAGLLADLAARTSLAMMLYDDGGHGCAIEEHARMVDLLAAGDAVGARRLMLRHLSTNQGRMQDAAQGRPGG